MKKENKALCQGSTKICVTSLRDVSNIIERKIKVAARGDKKSKNHVCTAT